jgi:hypothetical protein
MSLYSSTSSAMMDEIMGGAGNGNPVLTLAIISVLLIVVFGYLAFKSFKEKVQAEENRTPSFYEFMNGTTGKIPVKSILIGMVSGMVFGFIDNAGLFFGMDALDGPLANAYPGQGKVAELMRSGWGNTYSDALGSFLSVFIGRIVADKTGVTNTPIWAESIGLVFGCILGIYIPRYVKCTVMNSEICN